MKHVITNTHVSQEQTTKDYKVTFEERLYATDFNLLKFLLSSKKIDYSHEYIASQIKVNERTVRRSIKRLVANNIIQYIWRPYNTCLYVINKEYTTPEFVSWFKRYMVGFMAIAMLAPFYPLRPTINIKCLSLSKRTGTNVQTVPITSVRTEPLRRLLYLPETVWLYVPEKDHEPNKKMSFEQFEAQFFNEQEQYMLAFTEEQLRQLEQYPKEAWDYANRMVAKDLMAGKTISNQFGYFLSICKAHANKNPQMGKTATQNNPKPQQAWQQKDDEERETLRIRRETIKAKARDMHIPDIQYRTVYELEMIMNGYQLPPVTQARKDQVDKGLAKPFTPQDWVELCNVAAKNMEQTAPEPASFNDKKETAAEPATNWNDLIFQVPFFEGSTDLDEVLD